MFRGKVYTLTTNDAGSMVSSRPMRAAEGHIIRADNAGTNSPADNRGRPPTSASSAPPPATSMSVTPAVQFELANRRRSDKDNGGELMADPENVDADLKDKKREKSGYETEDVTEDETSCCGFVLVIFSYLLVLVTFPLSLLFCIKVVQEYERAVIFRLGRIAKGGARGPGLFFVLPCLDNYQKIDLRTIAFDVPPQEVLTKDSVTVAVDAVVYYRIHNASVSVTNVEDCNRSTRLLAATTLRNVLGTKSLSDLLADREQIAEVMKSTLDDATENWGVRVERVEIKDVRLPVQLQRAMAAEAEAAREARAKVIAAEGEENASRALREAAIVLSSCPAAIQLRYLQTLNSISAEKNSTIIFPVPIDLIQAFMAPKCEVTLLPPTPE